MLPDSLALPGLVAPITWRRSRRARRISLRIEPRAGGVIVTVPQRTSAAAAHAMLVAHRDWVAERLARLPRSIAFCAGALVPVDGVPRRIVHRPGLRGGVVLAPDALVVTCDAPHLERRVSEWLRTYARQVLGGMALAKAAAAGLTVRRITIKDTQTRWGSCTASGTLMFSWRLIMAPAEVQDYVVGHEVAHLRHLNHGREFWALTSRLTPHRAVADAWLAQHGAGLMRVG